VVLYTEFSEHEGILLKLLPIMFNIYGRLLYVYYKESPLFTDSIQFRRVHLNKSKLKRKKNQENNEDESPKKRDPIA
jgi:hypothetical protein